MGATHKPVGSGIAPTAELTAPRLRASLTVWSAVTAEQQICGELNVCC